MKPSNKSLEAEKLAVIHDETKPSLGHVEVLSELPSKLENVPNPDMTAKDQWRQLWTAIRAEKRYCCWAVFTILLVFSWGYDSGLSGIAIAFPEFRKAYGNYYAAGDEFVIPALWQSLWNAASTIGQVFGGYAAGQFADYWGRKFLLYLAIAISLASSFALVFAPSLPVLFVSKLLLGLSVGLSTVLPPLYVTENAPTELRSTFSSLTNVMIVFGQFCASMTGYGASGIDGVWSFKLAFVMTFLPPGIYLCGLPFLPESPVWYVKKGRDDDARKAILRLYGPNTNVDECMERIKTELRQTENDESAASQTNWMSIFSKEHRSRTLVAVLGLQAQNFSGGYFANTYQTYYFQLIGQADSFQLTAISSSLQLLSNFIALCLSDVIPRRNGLIGGGSFLMLWSVIIAGVSMAPTSNGSANTAILAFMITWSMLYTATVGCYGWAVAQETAAQATRPKTISFVLICQQLTALLLSSVFPYFINPDELNWGGKVMFLFVGVELFIMAGLYIFQPETQNRSYTDIDALYAGKVPPRKFKNFVIVNGEAVRTTRNGGFIRRVFGKAQHVKNGLC